MIEPSVLVLDTGRRTLEASIGTGFAAGVTGFNGDGAYAFKLTAEAGGGSAGFNGDLSGLLLGGYQLTDGPHALLLRGGLAAGLQGNNAFFFRSVELPRLELGYAHANAPYDRGWSLEVGAHGGGDLAVKYRAGSITHEPGVTAATGAFLWTTWQRRHDMFSVVLDATRVGVEHDDLVSVDGRVCGVLGGLALCGHALWVSAPKTASSSSSNAVVIGASVGVIAPFGGCP